MANLSNLDLKAVVDILRPVVATKSLPPDALRGLIGTIGELMTLAPPARAAEPQERTVEPKRARRRPVSAPAAVAAVLAPDVDAEPAVSETAAPPAIEVVPPRRRGRPRKQPLEVGAVVDRPARDTVLRLRRPDPEPVVEAPAIERAAPELLRKTAVKPPPAPIVQPVRPASETVRGTVRWFDPRTRQGAIRVRGSSFDLSFGADVAQGSGMGSLFKGQEIEAVVMHGGEADTVTQLRPLSATNATTELAGLGVAMRGTRKVVTVEVRRKRQTL